MDDAVDIFAVAATDPDHHLQGIQGQLDRHRRSGAPYDDAATVDVTAALKKYRRLTERTP
jgi:hypothetical protein